MTAKISDYGCVRFQQSIFGRLANDAGNRGCMSVDGSIHAAAFLVTEETAARYMVAVRDSHDGTVSAEFYVNAKLLSQMAMLHALYVSAGRQVFQFTPTIVGEFARTDLVETPIGRLRLPYAAGFLHFGRQSNLCLPEDWWRAEDEYVDGAYYHCGPQGQLTVQLTLSREDGSWSRVPGPHFSISPNLLDRPAHSVIDEVLDAEIVDELDGDVEHANAVGDALKEWDQINRPVLHAALSLVLNALFYLDAYGADTGQVVPDSVPKELRDAFEKAAKAAKPKLVRNAKNALMDEGFAVVRLCGTKFNRGEDSAFAADESRGVRTHWRRGHWRMQPCGPALSETKRVWVRPTLVGKGLGSPVKAHSYVVSDQKQ